MGMYGGWNGFGFLFIAIVIVFPVWKILTKAGFHGAWSLLALVPLVNIIALWLLAFSEWPRHREGA